MTSRFVHFQIGAVDADRLADFYSNVFGWTIRSIPLTSPEPHPKGPYHRITADDAGLSGGVTGLGPRGIVLTVEVDHIDETLERAESLGGRRTADVEPEHRVLGLARTFAMHGFVDPEGNQVQVLELLTKESGPLENVVILPFPAPPAPVE
jgi:uncharacterized protein